MQLKPSVQQALWDELFRSTHRLRQCFAQVSDHHRPGQELRRHHRENSLVGRGQQGFTGIGPKVLSGDAGHRNQEAAVEQGVGADKAGWSARFAGSRWSPALPLNPVLCGPECSETASTPRGRTQGGSMSRLRRLLGLDASAPESRLPAVGRNEPCPCGSGKKYKRCCLDKEAASGRDDRLASSLRREIPTASPVDSQPFSEENQQPYPRRSEI